MQVVTVLVFSLCAASGASQPRSANQNLPFRDDQNGYFVMVPPNGWTLVREPDARTKVVWRLPSNADVLLRVIARRATENIDKVRADALATARNYTARGVPTTVQDQKVGQWPAVVIDQTLRQARSRIVLFVADRVHFNVQFAAPTESSFNGSLGIAMRSLDTLAVLPQAGGSDDRARQEELAWYKRYTFLLEQIGEVAASRALAAEGAAKFPDDTELKARAGRK